MDARSTGLIVAGAIALMLAGLVLLVAINHKTSWRDRSNDLPLDISQRPPGAGGEVVDLAAQATGRFQAVDKDDPTRVAWELLFAKLDPVGTGVYKLTAPRAWIYMSDGQVVYVRADSGTVKKPAAVEGQIESGTFSGNVVAMVFSDKSRQSASDHATVIAALWARTAASESATQPSSEPPDLGEIGTAGGGEGGAGGDGRRAWDPDRDRPWLLAVAETIDFDTILLELSTQTAVRISTQDVQFDGASLVIRGNQVRNRIEYLNVGGPGTIRTAARDEPASAPTTDALATPVGFQSRPSPSRPAQAGDDAAPAQEDWYKAVFSDEVVAVQAGRKLLADRLDVWVRTLDNKLPEGVFGDEGSVNVQTTSVHAGDHIAAEPVTQRNAELLSDASSSQAIQVRGYRYQPMSFTPDEQASGPVLGRVDVSPRTLFTDHEGDVVLNWNGTLTAQPQAAMPAELAGGNHLLSRFTSERAGQVRFGDDATGAIGQAGVVEYAATSRLLTISNATALPRAWVFLPGSGFFVGDRAEVELAPGLARRPGPGLLAAREAPASDGADASSGIEFGPAETIAGEQGLPIGESRRIEWGERAAFEFATRDGRMTSDLNKATFIGTVSAFDEQSTLTGEQLVAVFSRPASDPKRWTHLGAAPQFSPLPGGSGTEPIGPDTSLAMVRSKRPRIEVFGAGRFEHQQEAKPNEADRVVVTWSKSMVFDELGTAATTSGDPVAGEDVSTTDHRIGGEGGGGTILCDGDAVATASGALVLDVVKAYRVRLDLEGPSGGSAASATSGGTTTGQELIGGGRIRRAEATGESLERRGAPNATVESRRYAPPSTTGGSRTLEQVAYLEGERLIADETANTVHVPGAGRAVFLDQRADEAALSVQPAPGVANSGITTSVSSAAASRGTSRFDWKGSMLFRRTDGIVTLADTVEMVHKPIGDAPYVRLTCSDLEAQLTTSEQAGRDAALRAGSLSTATATGNVYIESADRKKMVAERAVYDAVRGVMEATAEGDNLVSVFDEAAAAPMRARRMRWDFARERIEIVEPAPTGLGSGR